MSLGVAHGSVVRAFGPTAIAALPRTCVGDGVRIVRRDGSALAGRVATVARNRAAIVPFGSLDGVAAGDRVEFAPDVLSSVLGFGLLGRAIDQASRPLDGGRPIRGSVYRVAATVPQPLERRPIGEIFVTGIRAIDAMLTIGRGARVGLFGVPGTGKTTLLERLVEGASADVVVVALVGERGREARRWIERLTGNLTIICATADRSPAERIRAAEIALAQANSLRERGMHVLLLVDSLARYAGALRERANALGEPVGRGGYPPSVWSEFGRYLEAGGNSRTGSITLVASVLADGDDERDPVCVAARAALDGHVVLSAALARAGRFPSIDVVASVSRTMDAVIDDAHRAEATIVREALALLAATEDVRAAGFGGAANPSLARALSAGAELERFFRQTEPVPFALTRAELAALANKLA